MADKRAKVHRLPTKDNKPAIWLHDDNTLINNTKSPILNKWFDVTGHHLYFTTGEEIKAGNYIIDDNGVFGPWEAGDVIIGKHKGVIISTTDESLGLPQPSQAFIEKYCQVGGIDEVLIEYELKNTLFGDDQYERLKVDSHNTITIHSIRNSWSREEHILNLEAVMALGINYQKYGSKLTATEELQGWIKENL